MSQTTQRLARSLVLLGRPAQQQIAVALQQHDVLQSTAVWCRGVQADTCCSTSSYHVPQLSQHMSMSTGPGVSRTASTSTNHAQAMQLANALSTPAKSLYHERAPIRLPPPLNTKMGHVLLSMLGFYSHKSQLLHGGQALYTAIKEQCEDGALTRAFGLDPSLFFSTYTLLSLHVWLVVHRLAGRTDRDARDFKQRFYENFQNDVERRVHRMVSVGVTKWLKQLETVFYSSGIAFDKVLSGESKETFTEVILRHHFGSDVTKKSQAALIAKYIQRELHCLQLTDDDKILRGHIRFSQEPFEGVRAAMAEEKDKAKKAEGKR